MNAERMAAIRAQREALEPFVDEQVIEATRRLLEQYEETWRLLSRV